MSETEYWGRHLVLNAGDCAPAAIRSKKTIYDFCKKLVEKIDMVAYGEPQIVHFGEGNKAGYTLVQLIETSNICAHFVEETNDIYLDVFSCKEFQQDVVKNLVIEYFKPNRVHYNHFDRKA